tara:strand:+ start:210 stop:419 length:210 start_codon:yes stop_codon:yes gene_type:complete
MINMVDWQRVVLQKKFGKKRNKFLSQNAFYLLLLGIALIFISLFFPDIESQVLSSSSFPGFHKGVTLYG